MNCEQKYKDLIKAIKELQEANPSDERIQNWINENVPELRENEDEKIRKEIINFIKGQEKISAIDTPMYQTWITWLEKQGKHLENYDKDMLGAIEYCKKNNRPLEKEHIAWLEKQGQTFTKKDVDDAYLKGVCDTKQELEKQGEQNPYSGVSFEYNGHTWGMCARDGGVEIAIDSELKAFVSLDKSFIYPNRPQKILVPQSVHEAVKEEKADNVNKVEPKFKVGDLVMLDRPVLITKVEDMLYNTHQYWTSDGTWFGDATKAKLWTIKDAKDGDVLTNGKMIVIFKHFEDPSYRQHIVAYIGLDNSGNIQITNDTWYLGIDKSKPATKEQREQLEKAMADAGYTFDFEKKELKEIEHNVQLTEFEEAVKDLMNDYRDAIGDNDATIEEVKGHAAYMLSLIHQNSAEWSEEDEYNLAFIQEALLGLDGDDAYREKCCKMVEWLNSLKERVGCAIHFTTTKAWSANDEKMLNSFLHKLEVCDLLLSNKEVIWIKNKLKSLIPQSTWKPSDEQMERLKGAINSLPHQEVLYSLYQELKKLREE